MPEMWECNVCGQERPDDKIDVARHRVVYANGVELMQNVRYCNDNLHCADVAMRSTHIDLALNRTSFWLGEMQEALANLASARLRLISVSFLVGALAVVVGIYLWGFLL